MKALENLRISVLRTNYREMIPDGRTERTGAHTMIGGPYAATPPKRALHACPRHSSEEDIHPVVKRREQPQKNSKIHFILNDVHWLTFRAESAGEKEEQADDQNQAKAAPTDNGTAKIKPAAAEQKHQ